MAIITKKGFRFRNYHSSVHDREEVLFTILTIPGFISKLLLEEEININVVLKYGADYRNSEKGFGLIHCSKHLCDLGINHEKDEDEKISHLEYILKERIDNTVKIYKLNEQNKFAILLTGIILYVKYIPTEKVFSIITIINWDGSKPKDSVRLNNGNDYLTLRT